MVTSSEGGASPALRGEPSQLTSVEVEETAGAKRSCRRQAWLWQSTLGTRRLPLPVSKTTEKGCGGVPMRSSPKYAVLCTTPERRRAALESRCTRTLRRASATDMPAARTAQSVIANNA